MIRIMLCRTRGRLPQHVIATMGLLCLWTIPSDAISSHSTRASTPRCNPLNGHLAGKVNEPTRLHVSAGDFSGRLLEASESNRETVIASLLDRVPRGGSMTQSEDEDEATYPVKILRKAVLSILEMGERQSLFIANIIRSFVRCLEKLANVRLLPNEPERHTEEVGVENTKQKRRRRSKSLAKKKSDVRSSSSHGSSKKVTTKVAKKRKKESSATTTSVPKPRPKKAKLSTSKTQVGQQHLKKELKTSNPNHRIQRELKEFLTSPPPNLRVAVGKNIRVWIVTITGAENTVFEGEKYRLRIAFPDRYPMAPPSVYFLKPTPRHEHVYTNGDICLSLLGKDWRPTMTAQSIAVSILSMLSSARKKELPMDNSRVSGMKPGQPQDNWVYHDDNC